jgi:hypothetical protein
MGNEGNWYVGNGGHGYGCYGYHGYGVGCGVFTFSHFYIF